MRQHSPLGGSGAPRWMRCPGSVRLSYGVADEQSDHAELGTAAHSLAEISLRTNKDAWETIGGYITWFREDESLASVPVDDDMANAVQVYLDTMRSLRENADARWIEVPFHATDIHELCYGAIDYAMLFRRERVFDVTDYKHGAGVVVEAEGNEQLMYYGAGIMSAFGLWDSIDRVRLRIVQPRGFHWEGPVRTWEIATDDLKHWTEWELKPAMERALVSNHTEAGSWCRFCPARGRQCPAMIEAMEDLRKMIELKKEDAAGEMSADEIGNMLDLFDLAKIRVKAAESEGFKRANAGHTIPGRKLVRARSNREWKPDGGTAVAEKLGEKAYTKPEILSPSKVEKLPGGEKLVARYAHKPDRGLTLVRADDPRAAAKVQNVKQAFKKEN